MIYFLRCAKKSLKKKELVLCFFFITGFISFTKDAFLEEIGREKNNFEKFAMQCIKRNFSLNLLHWCPLDFRIGTFANENDNEKIEEKLFCTAMLVFCCTIKKIVYFHSCL